MRVNVGGVVDDRVVLFSQEMRVIFGWTVGEARAEKISFIKSVQTVFDHQFCQLLVLDFILSVGIERGELVMSSQFEI